MHATICILLGVLCVLLACPASAEWGEPVLLPPEVNQYGAYYARLAPYDTELYFTCDTSTALYDDIWVVRWNEGVWDSTTRLGLNVNTSQRDLSPSVTADHEYLYFVSYNRPGGYGSYDVWCSTWEDTGWGVARNCGPAVNTAGIEFTACIAPDGEELYFTSIRPGGIGESDLWCSAWEDTGWGPAENLGPNVNTTSRDLSPWISGDSQWLYWDSWASVHGYQDIYLSHHDSSGWSPRQVVPPPISTVDCDICPSLSSDERFLFFCSTREGCPVGCMWMSEWITEVDEKEGWTPGATFAGGSILRCIPNPSSDHVTIRLGLPEPIAVSLDIFDVLGRHVRSLIHDYGRPGQHEVMWDGRDEHGQSVQSGVYFCRLHAVMSYSSCKKGNGVTS